MDDVVDLVHLLGIIRDMVTVQVTSGRMVAHPLGSIDDVRFSRATKGVIYLVPDTEVRVRRLMFLALDLLNIPAHRRRMIQLPFLCCSAKRHHQLRRVLTFLEPAPPHRMFSLIDIQNYLDVIDTNGFHDNNEDRKRRRLERDIVPQRRMESAAAAAIDAVVVDPTAEQNPPANGRFSNLRSGWSRLVRRFKRSPNTTQGNEAPIEPHRSPPRRSNSYALQIRPDMTLNIQMQHNNDPPLPPTRPYFTAPPQDATGDTQSNESVESSTDRT